MKKSVNLVAKKLVNLHTKISFALYGGKSLGVGKNCFNS